MEVNYLCYIPFIPVFPFFFLFVLGLLALHLPFVFFLSSLFFFFHALRLSVSVSPPINHPCRQLLRLLESLDAAVTFEHVASHVEILSHQKHAWAGFQYHLRHLVIKDVDVHRHVVGFVANFFI
jgi:hypothetical protein